MKLIIAGSRDLKLSEEQIFTIIEEELDDLNVVPEIIFSGNSGKVDLIGELYAITKGIPLRLFKADWDKYGTAAGPIRNQLMVNEADILLLIWDDISRGSRDIFKKAIKQKIKVHEVII